MITERDFINFKTGVLNFVEKHQWDILQAFQNQLTIFKNNYLLIKRLIEEINVKEAEDFNIFNILGFDYLEVKTHTPFLAELLNPKGSHGQGDLFLIKFFQIINFVPSLEINNNNWKVIKESEFIDLRIINYKLKKAIFIENKILTGSHSGQLSRYYKKWIEGFPNGGKFLYLTIFGDPPDEAGFDDSIDPKFPREVINKNLLCISYKKHIKQWLETSIPDIQAIKVREIITQYLQLINTF